MSIFLMYFFLLLCSKTEELENTGILLTSTQQPYHSDSTESLPFKSTFHFDVRLQQKFRLQPILTPQVRDCLITSDQLVFIDHIHERLFIYNINGSYNRDITLSRVPFRISVINENDVAISYNNKFIDIINITTGQMKNKIATSRDTLAISYQSGLIYALIDDQKIDVMNMTGKIIQSFQCPLKLTEPCLSTDTDSMFLISPFDDTLYCCDLKGSIKWRFNDDMMITPIGVTRDGNSNVYVICNGSDNVIVVSPDGKHHTELLTVKDGLENPTGIYYDKSNECLLVCNEENGGAFLFDVKHSTNNK